MSHKIFAQSTTDPGRGVSITLMEALQTLAAEDNADEIRLNDGAVTWDIYNLMDVARDDDGDYALILDQGIYRLRDDGYIETTPAYRFEAMDGAKPVQR